MKNEMKWFNRKFLFDYPVEMYPMVVERLRGTPARLEEKLKDLPEEMLIRKPEGKWSLKEQVGHLSDLEELWRGRLDDFLNGAGTLRAANITNTKTIYANHNAASMISILNNFRDERTRLVAVLDRLDLIQAGLLARHPRLNQPMRLIDSLFFMAEHDDHHLAVMTDLIDQ